MIGVAKAIPTQRQVALMARAYMDSKGLNRWHFKLNTNKRRLGVCKYRRLSIELSVHVLPLGWAQIEDTIKHEVAHALVGHAAGHGPVWQRKAIELGCKPNRCAEGVKQLVEPKFIGHCPKCGKTTKKHKRSRTACRDCCNRYNGGKYSEEYAFDWERRVA